MGIIPEGEVHVYVFAPPPFRLVVALMQITGLLAVPVTTGRVLTVTLTTAALVLVQPAMSVPVKE